MSFGNAGQAAFTVVGGVVGYFAGNPMLGAQIGGAIGTAVFPTKLQGPQLNDLPVTTSAAGVPIPILVGKPRPFPGCVIFQGQPVLIDVEEGGKGGPIIKTQSRLLSFATGFCEGAEDLLLLRLWFNRRLVYDRTGIPPAGNDYESAEWQEYNRVKASTERLAQYLTIYTGTADQDPDPTLEAYYGVGNVPGFRGLAYLVWTLLPLKEYGEVMPDVSAEWGQGTVQETEVTQRTVDELHEWIDDATGSIDPRNCANDHTYAFGSSGFGTFEDTIDYAIAQIAPGDPRTAQLIGWSLPSGALAFNHMSPKFALDPDEVLDIVLHYNMMTPTSFVGDVNVTITEPCDLIDALGITTTPGVWWSGVNNGVTGVGFADGPGIYFLINDGDPVPTGAGVVANLIGQPCGPGYILSYPDLNFSVRRTLRAPDNPCTPQCITPYPLLPEDPNFCVIAGLIQRSGSYTYEAGSFKQLQNYTTTGVAPAIVQKYPVGPVIVSGSADDTQAFWEAAYADNQADAVPPLRMAGGLTYGADYPVVAGHAYYRTWIQSEIALIPKQVKDAVELVCLREGFVPGEFDVSELTESLPGYLMSRPAAGRDNITPLMAYSFFNGVDVDGQIIFPLRARAASFALTIEDLGAHPYKGSQPKLLHWEHLPDEELLQTARVHYQQEGLNTPSMQPYTWQLTDSRNAQDLELAITMRDDKAAQIAEITVHEVRTQRDKLTFFIGGSWRTQVIPGAVGTIDMGNGTVYTVIVADRLYTSPSLIEVHAVPHNIDDYSSEATAANPPIYNDDLDVAGPIELILLDLPALRAGDDDAGYYVAAGPLLEIDNYQGGVLFRSDDAGSSYHQVAELNAAATRGTVQEAFADWNDRTYDPGSVTVELQPGSGSLSSLELGAFLNRGNVCAVRAGDHWEVLQFRYADLNSDGSYTLAGFLRGLLGTAIYCGDHEAGDTFVLLNAAVRRLVESVGAIGQARMFKAVPLGLPLDDNISAVDFTPGGESLRPLVPLMLVAYLRGDGSVDADWHRQDRHPNDLVDGVDLPMSESVERYRLRVLRAGASIYEMTVDGDSQGTVPSVAGAIAGDLLEVAQVSTVAGPGHAATVAIIASS